MRENPTTDRLRFILKQYGKSQPRVVVDMVDIVGRTIGADRWWTELRDLTMQADPNFYRDLGRYTAESWDAPPEYAAVLVDLVSGMPQFVLRNRADPMFPWMAAKLNEAAKEDDGEHRQRGTHFSVYATTRNNLRAGGSMLAQWFEATRPNLNRMDFDEAWHAATKWHEEKKANEPPPQGEVVVELSDGWTAQSLSTKDQLNAEGNLMQHCVGSYFSEISRGTTIVSLRDARGFPHVTIEIKNDRVQQVKGKQNEKPAAKYEKYVDEFMEHLKEEGVETSRIPPHLQAMAALLEERFRDIDEEHLADYAYEWDQSVTVEDAKAWIDAGMYYSDLEILGALVGENVTPDEYAKFPGVLLYHWGNHSGLGRKADEQVALARMTVALVDLLPFREPVPISTQTEMWERPSDPPRRREGQDPGHPGKGYEYDYKEAQYDFYERVNEPAEERAERKKEWEKGQSKNDWLLAAQEWIASGFKSDPDDDEYVGPWFVHNFTNDEADSWWAAGIENGHVAAELRARRVTLAMIDDLRERDVALPNMERPYHDRKQAPWTAEPTRRDAAIAEEIVDAIDDNGIVRNPRSRRSSR